MFNSKEIALLKNCILSKIEQKNAVLDLVLERKKKKNEDWSEDWYVQIIENDIEELRKILDKINLN